MNDQWADQYDVWQDDWESDDEQPDYDDINNPFFVLRCMMAVNDYSDSDTSTEEFEEELDSIEQEGDGVVAHLHDSLVADGFNLRNRLTNSPKWPMSCVYRQPSMLQ